MNVEAEQHTSAALELELLQEDVHELLVRLRVEDLVVPRVALRPVEERDELLGLQLGAVLRAASIRIRTAFRINECCFHPEKTIRLRSSPLV